MNFNLHVKLNDGTSTDVVGIAADIVAFETKFDMSMARLEKELKMTHLFYLAWHVLHRTGETKLDFDKWLETVDMVSAAEPKK
jgi:hypothetical protein